MHGVRGLGMHLEPKNCAQLSWLDARRAIPRSWSTSIQGGCAMIPRACSKAPTGPSARVLPSSLRKRLSPCFRALLSRLAATPCCRAVLSRIRSCVCYPRPPCAMKSQKTVSDQRLPLPSVCHLCIAPSPHRQTTCLACLCCSHTLATGGAAARTVSALQRPVPRAVCDHQGGPRVEACSSNTYDRS